MIAGVLLAGILAVTLAGCKNTDNTKEEIDALVAGIRRVAQMF